MRPTFQKKKEEREHVTVVARKSFGKTVSKWDLETDSLAISDN